MSEKPTRRTVLKSAAMVAAGAAAPSLMAKEVTLHELSLQLAQPLDPGTEKLAEAALRDVQETSANRRKHRLPENSEPCFVFQIREGATTKW